MIVDLTRPQKDLLISLADEPRGLSKRNPVAIVLVRRGLAKWHDAELRITPEGTAMLEFLGLIE
jgi:hypothetical protein